MLMSQFSERLQTSLAGHIAQTLLAHEALYNLSIKYETFEAVYSIDNKLNNFLVLYFLTFQGYSCFLLYARFSRRI